MTPDSLGPRDTLRPTTPNDQERIFKKKVLVVAKLTGVRGLNNEWLMLPPPTPRSQEDGTGGTPFPASTRL